MTRVRNYNYSVDHDLSSKPLFKMQTKAEATASLRIEPLQLPAARFRYMKWTDIESVNTTGSELAAPRIRGAPATMKQPPSITPVECKRLEDWEHASVINFSYQELADEFQVDEFIAALNRAQQAKVLRLENNQIKSMNDVLAKVELKACTHFYAANNHFDSFANLPHMPNLVFLDLRRNNITSVDGIERFPKLESVELNECPISFEGDYRSRLATKHKSLGIIDNIRVSSDEQSSN